MNTITRFTWIKFNFLRAVAFATYKEWSVYRSHSLVSVFVGPLYFLVQLFIWKSVYATRHSISGLTLDQMITYFAIAALINYAIMDFADWNLQMLIHTGKFMTYILRPMSHIYFAFSQKVGHRILGITIELLPVYIILAFVFKIRLFPAQPFWAVLSIILGFIMMFLIDYCVGITAFWLTRTSGIRRMFLLLRDVCSGVLLPLALFPDSIQKLFFVLPFQFIAYVPVRVFIGSYELAGLKLTIPQIVGLQAFATIIMVFFTFWFYKKGIQKFTGVGA
jgi:ABC-2 type transport system permease protein